MRVRSTYTGFLGVAGVPTMVHKGDEFDLNHPVVAAHPKLFVEVLEVAPEPKPAPPAPKPAPAPAAVRRGRPPKPKASS